jgi:glycosyltransferase involved in cell wall biosynthesis
MLNRRWNVVVVDDGPTDCSRELLAGWPDPRVRVLRQPNAGRSAARNLGVALALGQWVVFCDDDRIAAPHFLPAFAVVLTLHACLPSVREAPGLQPWWQFATFPFRDHRIDSMNNKRRQNARRAVGLERMRVHDLRHPLPYFPDFLEPRRTAEKALNLVKALGTSGVSKSEVNRLCAEVDAHAGAFLNRPIEGDWPCLWIDATYVKTREAGRLVSVAVIGAVAVH